MRTLHVHTSVFVMASASGLPQKPEEVEPGQKLIKEFMRKKTEKLPDHDGHKIFASCEGDEPKTNTAAVGQTLMDDEHKLRTIAASAIGSSPRTLAVASSGGRQPS